MRYLSNELILNSNKKIMKSSKLISTIILAQVALIFISFKTPELLLSKKNTTTNGNKITVNNQKDLKQDLELISTKNIKKKTGKTSYNFNYPFLDESKNAKNYVFNNYVDQNILNATDGFLNSNYLKDMHCSEFNVYESRNKQLLDYKTYYQSNSLVSILLFKGDYLHQDTYPLYAFKTLNYDSKNAKFLNYEQVFKTNKEKELLTLINQHYSENHTKMECWQLNEVEFMKNKDNFTISNDAIKFYFNKCAICPKYSGEYSVEIPISKIKPFLSSEYFFESNK